MLVNLDKQNLTKKIKVYTSTAKHAIEDTEQYCKCGVLDDPNNMDDIQGKAYCINCSNGGLK